MPRVVCMSLREFLIWFLILLVECLLRVVAWKPVMRRFFPPRGVCGMECDRCPTIIRTPCHLWITLNAKLAYL